MEYTGEQIIPWHRESGPIMSHHLMRYAWASTFCYDKTVLDLGCGTGYGTHMLSMTATWALGVEIDYPVYKWASHFFEFPMNCLFQHADVTNFEFFDSSFNVVVALEVLEHLDDPRAVVDYWVDRGATFIFSVPLEDEPTKFHKHSWTDPYDMADELCPAPVDLWYQYGTGIIVPAEIDEAADERLPDRASTPAVKHVLGVIKP
jgi:SAM-dependent methyltransferase